MIDNEIKYIKDRIETYKGGYIPISYGEEIIIKLDKVQQHIYDNNEVFLDIIKLIRKAHLDGEANYWIQRIQMTMNKTDDLINKGIHNE